MIIDEYIYIFDFLILMFNHESLIINRYIRTLLLYLDMATVSRIECPHTYDCNVAIM